jgi:hypothetical protein
VLGGVAESTGDRNRNDVTRVRIAKEGAFPSGRWKSDLGETKESVNEKRTNDTHSFAHGWPFYEQLSVTCSAEWHLQVIVITVQRGPEKAGVGGSTPSLATIIPQHLAAPFCARSVRSRSAFSEGAETGRCTQMISNNLVRTCSSSVRFQSALSVAPLRTL